MIVRALSPADAESYRSLRRRVLHQTAGSFAIIVDEQAGLRNECVERLRPADDQAIFGAFEDRALVGMTGVRRDVFRGQSHRAHLWGVYVEPSSRRRGVGRQLLAAALVFATRIRGVSEINLSVATMNTPAMNLYLSLGFDAACESASIFDGDLAEDELHMKLCRARQDLNSDNAFEPFPRSLQIVQSQGVDRPSARRRARRHTTHEDATYGR